jgi:hypothetical protein
LLDSPLAVSKASQEVLHKDHQQDSNPVVPEVPQVG